LGTNGGRNGKGVLGRLFLSVAILAGATAVWPLDLAEAAPRRVVIRGGGWGHGLGLSQWGSYGRALDGQRARRIIKHYYTGVDVAEGKHPRSLRIGIGQARSAINLGTDPIRSGGGDISFRVRGYPGDVAGGGPGASWRLEPVADGRVRIHKNGDVVRHNGRSAFGRTNHPLIVEYERHASLLHIAEEGNRYRYGKLIVEPYHAPCGPGHCLRMVMKIPMQEYLFGVAEVSASWPKESLKVQAILSRTYVSHSVNSYGQHRSTCNCAVYDTALDQVFVGNDRRTDSGPYWSRWRNAVDGTNHQVVLYNGRPILALYMSSSGGHTENNENVWGGSRIPYLRGVRDPHDRVAPNSNHKWRVGMSWSTLSSRLNAAFGTGKLRRFNVQGPRGVSGRVTIVKGPRRGGVKVVGSARTVRVSGNAVKSALGLNDTLFRVRFVD
jgi:stage II sporulation protein D